MSDSASKENKDILQEQRLEKMEALLKQSAMGIHVLFDNKDITSAMQDNKRAQDIVDFKKMQQIQDIMTSLIAKPSYFEKMSYLKELDQDSYRMLIRTYFHIVENTVRQGKDCH